VRLHPAGSALSQPTDPAACVACCLVGARRFAGARGAGAAAGGARRLLSPIAAPGSSVVCFTAFSFAASFAVWIRARTLGSNIDDYPRRSTLQLSNRLPPANHLASAQPFAHAQARNAGRHQERADSCTKASQQCQRATAMKRTQGRAHQRELPRRQLCGSRACTQFP
jgi:hypothetical protein